MIYEYRRCSIVPGKRAALGDCMANVTMQLWERHGINPVGFWEAVIGLSNELHYLLASKDMPERESHWKRVSDGPRVDRKA